MTLAESASLYPDQLRVAVAERMGWVFEWDGEGDNQTLTVYSPNGDKYRPLYVNSIPALVVEWLPNYPSDLNACHEMEQWIHEDSYRGYEYDMALCRVTQAYEDGQPCNHMRLYHATATQRCRALLAVSETRNE